MKLTVLGCAGSFPGPDSACSAYLVEAQGFRLLLDFGTGALGALQRWGDLHAVDAIVLTHLHCDHFLDACSYVVARRYDPRGPLPRIPLYGPAGTAERLAQTYGCDRGLDLDDVYDFHTIAGGRWPLGPFTVTATQMNHPIETYGVRVECGGKALAYSGDTGELPALVELARDADLFLCEASYLDDDRHPPDLHLTGAEAGAHAQAAQVRRLVLTHLVSAWGNPRETLAAARATFDGPVELASAGAIYHL